MALKIPEIVLPITNRSRAQSEISKSKMPVKATQSIE